MNQPPNRIARDERRTRDKIIDRAAQKGRAPGTPTFATPVSSTGGTATITTAIEGSFTEEAEDGGTLHDFMLGIDQLGDPHAILRANGDRYRYYAYEPT